MSDARSNLLVLQGGGPTPVVNTSLFGVIDEARRSPQVRRVLGARFGVQGLIENNLVDLSSLPTDQFLRLKSTPGAALGSTRVKPSKADFEHIIEVLRDLNVRWLLMIGGNGSLRGADMIGHFADRAGYDMTVIGVPKTIDNDIAMTDRCPGFASAARYVAQSVRDLGMDVRTLPQPVSIFETMGRSVGWLAGASVLGRMDPAHAPHLVYMPEKAFDLDHFLDDIDDVVTRNGWAVAVVTEGIRTASGKAVFETDYESQRDALGRAVAGGVAAHLAAHVTTRLKLRCRWEQPGLVGRTSMLHVAEQDRADAIYVGRAAVRAGLAGAHNHRHLLALLPLTDEQSETTHKMVPLAHLPHDRAVPTEWLGDSPAEPVATPFLRYARRLVGELIDFPTPLFESLPVLVEKETLAAKELLK